MSHLMSRRETAFTLWRPARTLPVPKVRIVSFVPGNSPSESLVFEGDLALTGDPDGSVGVRANTQNPLRLSTNHRLVIYELPSSWIGREPPLSLGGEGLYVRMIPTVPLSNTVAYDAAHVMADGMASTMGRRMSSRRRR